MIMIIQFIYSELLSFMHKHKKSTFVIKIHDSIRKIFRVLNSITPYKQGNRIPRFKKYIY